MVRGHTPAKPQWSEVIVFSDVLLRQSTPLQEETASSDEQCAHRNGDVPARLTPVSECSPEEESWLVAEVRRSRGCRR